MNNLMVRESGMTTIENIVFDEALAESWTSFIDASPKTKDTYNKAIKQFIYYLSDNGILYPTRDDVRNFRDELKENHKPTTIQTYITAVKLFFQWLESIGKYENVAVRIKGAKIDPTPKKDYLTMNQIHKLLGTIDRQTLKGKRDFAMILLMLTTGLRTISIINANIGDIRTRGDNSVLYYKGKGHDEKSAYVNLGANTEEAIREYLSAREETNGNAPLFAAIANRNSGERMTTRSISRVCKERLREAGYDSEMLSAHSFRHTAGCQNLLNGGTVEETQQMMDHKSVSTTMIYVHILDRDSNKSECRIDSAIFG